MVPELSVRFLGGGAYGSIGGIQTFNRGLLDTLDASGWLSGGFLANDAPADVPLPLKGRLACGHMSKVRLAAWAAASVFRKTDVVISDHLNYTPILRFLPCDKVRVTTLHAYEMQIPVSKWRRRAMDRMDAFICVSEYSKSLAMQLGLPEKKLHVCHHGINIDTNVGGEKRFPGAHPRVLFVGRLDRQYKGQDHLLQAARILKKSGVKFSINFAGGGDSLRRFRREAVNLGVDDCVTFHGFVPDQYLAMLYREADIFALPSSGEGFGLAYLEAMACGLPCVATTSGAAPEVVVAGECGLTITYGDVDHLVSALRQLIQDESMRMKLGAGALRRYREHFTRAAFRSRFQSLLLNLVGIGG